MLKLKHLTHFQHQGRRDYQEDVFAFGVVDTPSGKFNYAVICDGMGGHHDGALAAKIAASAFETSLREELREDGQVRRLSHHVTVADEAVMDKELELRPGGDRYAMGTTLVAVVWKEGEDTLRAVSVGDSFIVRVRTYGDSDPTFAEVTKRDESPWGGLTHWIGGGVPSTLNVMTVALQPGDTVVLASDGIEHAITAALLRNDLSGVEAADLIGAEVMDRQHAHQDNLTVVALRFEADE